MVELQPEEVGSEYLKVINICHGLRKYISCQRRYHDSNVAVYNSLFNECFFFLYVCCRPTERKSPAEENNSVFVSPWKPVVMKHTLMVWLHPFILYKHVHEHTCTVWWWWVKVWECESVVLHTDGPYVDLEQHSVEEP